ncbi:MAG: hypothetical protein HQK54_14450, partial [Oligoflexales bacterium]|nr:hypothetical protein [Oligoflexales bacterium]
MGKKGLSIAAALAVVLAAGLYYLKAKKEKEEKQKQQSAPKIEQISWPEVKSKIQKDPAIESRISEI